MTAESTRLRRLSEIAAPSVGVAILMGLWIWGGRAGWAGGMVISPADAIEPIFDGDSSSRYWRATRSTLWSALRGLAIGGLLAFGAAVAAAGIPPLRRTIVRVSAIANAAPWVAIAPCLIIILGRDRGPTAIAALAVFFYIFMSTTVGLSAAPQAAHDVVTVLGSSRRRRVWSVQLPAAWPSIADGLKLAAPAALAGAIFGEWYGAPRGLGVLLIAAMQGARPPDLWAASLLSAGIGLTAYALLAGVRTLLTRRYGNALGGTDIVDVAPDARRARRLVIDLAGVALLAGLLIGAWWTWIELADISPIVVPRPSAVLDDLVSTPSDYAGATAATLWNAAIAMVLGTVAGVLLALAASRHRLLAGMTVPLAVALAATPLVALFPLFARIFGYEPGTVRILASVLVFYPMFVYTRSGLSAASTSALDVVQALGAGPNARFRRVVLPAAVPHIASGLRIAAGSAIIAAVVGEFLIGRSGLGVEFSYAYRLLQLPRAFGAAIVIIGVSLVIFAVGSALERVVHRRWT